MMSLLHVNDLSELELSDGKCELDFVHLICKGCIVLSHNIQTLVYIYTAA